MHGCKWGTEPGPEHFYLLFKFNNVMPITKVVCCTEIKFELSTLEHPKQNTTITMLTSNSNHKKPHSKTDRKKKTEKKNRKKTDPPPPPLQEYNNNNTTNTLHTHTSQQSTKIIKNKSEGTESLLAVNRLPPVQICYSQIMHQQHRILFSSGFLQPRTGFIFQEIWILALYAHANDYMESYTFLLNHIDSHSSSQGSWLFWPVNKTVGLKLYFAVFLLPCNQSLYFEDCHNWCDDTHQVHFNHSNVTTELLFKALHFSQPYITVLTWKTYPQTIYVILKTYLLKSLSVC